MEKLSYNSNAFLTTEGSGRLKAPVDLTPLPTEQGTTQYNEKFHNLYYTLNILEVFKSSMRKTEAHARAWGLWKCIQNNFFLENFNACD
jgi:hypothetical protein